MLPLFAAFLVPPPAAADTADIAGLVYYSHQKLPPPKQSNLTGPVDGADVTLYKRTAAGGFPFVAVDFVDKALP